MALNDADSPVIIAGAEGDTPVKKKPRVYKKREKQQVQQASLTTADTSNMIPLNSDLSMDASSTADYSTIQSGSKLKIINKTKETSKRQQQPQSQEKLLLHIPKKSLNLAIAAPNESANSSGMSSPSVDILGYSEPSLISIGEPNQQSVAPTLAPKRQYNKQNSMSKKQQKLVAQQKQQQQLQMQMSQSPLMSTSNVASLATQFSNLFDFNQFGFGQLDTNQIDLAQQLMASMMFPNFTFPQTSQPATPTIQQQPSTSKRKNSTQASSSNQYDYLTKPHKKVDRRHADPLVSLSSILENILNELRELPEAVHFLMPVNAKKVPDYYNLVKNPIDLQAIRKRTNEKHYKNRQMFLEDMRLLTENSMLYNGAQHHITLASERLYEICIEKFNEQEDKLLKLEKAINPLLDDNSLIAFNYILEKIFEESIITVDNSLNFLKPVNKSKYKDYYDIIKNPIDLEVIKNRISTKKYKSREEFIGDFELLLNNSLTYNGPNNFYSKTAQKLLDACKQACLVEHDEQLHTLEEAIVLALEQQQQEQLQAQHNDEASRMSMDIMDNDSNAVGSYSDYLDFMGQLQPNLNQQHQQINKKKQSKSYKKSMSSLEIASEPLEGMELITNATEPGWMRQQQFSSSKANSKSKGKKSSHVLASFKSMIATSGRNSPKSGSDAEVFVDIESVDERNASLAIRFDDVEDEDEQVYSDRGAMKNSNKMQIDYENEFY
jgi:hypothetical protein